MRGSVCLELSPFLPGVASFSRQSVSSDSSSETKWIRIYMPPA